jgi:hypothetical protein
LKCTNFSLAMVAGSKHIIFFFGHGGWFSQKNAHNLHTKYRIMSVTKYNSSSSKLKRAFLSEW